MDYCIETSPLEKLQSDCAILGMYQDKQLCLSGLVLDSQTQELLQSIIARGDIKGKVGEALLINGLPSNFLPRILLVGLGENKPLTLKNYRKALSAAASNAKKHYIKSVTCALALCEVTHADWPWKVRQVVEVFADAAYQFAEFRSDKESDAKLDKVMVVVPEAQATLAQTGVLQGKAIADGMTLAKYLADLPGNVCTPSFLAHQAIDLANKHAKLSVNILEEDDMKALGMNVFLSVSRGSRQPAKLIHLSYQGGSAEQKPIVLVGKGLTFDAGGISLKPGPGMDEMKYDMCGGAVVLGTLQAAAQMGLPLNIIGLVPSSENLPDGDANKPGDIWISMSGKSVEILNTDAEGRLILCDTLTYAERFKPEVVIDLATLTGACLVALGRVPSGLLGNDDTLCNDLIAASETALDSVWRLPLWEEYQELLKSNFADLANIGGKDAGTITAACFLSRFAENFRWAHLDIAGTAWRTGNNKGATGRPLPLLSQYLINRANSKEQ